MSISIESTKPPGHNFFSLDDGVQFCSEFDNGNLLRVMRGTTPYEYMIWTAPDNTGQSYESKYNAWFYFYVTGVPPTTCLKMQVMNTNRHAGLYKYDMRPVFKANSTNNKWLRIRNPVKFQKISSDSAQLCFEHVVDNQDDKVFFSFTYPYSYDQLQKDLSILSDFQNIMSIPESIYCKRQVLVHSLEGRIVDLITISSVDGAANELEQNNFSSGLFPAIKQENEQQVFDMSQNNFPHIFPNKEVVFISARVHPGEVPAQHTMKGILNFLLDPSDKRAKELRKRYVFKIIPMLNPDGVFRGHFRMDTLGQNLNRYYNAPTIDKQPTIYAAKTLIDFYARTNQLVMYLDLHAHASKRGCFIYGNVMDNLDVQVQNQLFCRLIALNSPHFDYEGCLFSREHMVRIDPGDAEHGLTAEGSGA